jgi:acyl carrier protein
MRSMTDAEIRNKVTSILSEITDQGREAVEASPSLKDLGKWDSLSLLEFILEATKIFGIEIEPAELRNCFTFDDLVRVIQLHREPMAISCTQS